MNVTAIPNRGGRPRGPQRPITTRLGDAFAAELLRQTKYGVPSISPSTGMPVIDEKGREVRRPAPPEVLALASEFLSRLGAVSLASIPPSESHEADWRGVVRARSAALEQPPAADTKDHWAQARRECVAEQVRDAAAARESNT